MPPSHVHDFLISSEALADCHTRSGKVLNHRRSVGGGIQMKCKKNDAFGGPAPQLMKGAASIKWWGVDLFSTEETTTGIHSIHKERLFWCKNKTYCRKIRAFETVYLPNKKPILKLTDLHFLNCPINLFIDKVSLVWPFYHFGFSSFFYFFSHLCCYFDDYVLP